MKDRTVVLVSHHVRLCAPGASYIVALDNGRVSFSGDYAEFKSSGVLETLVQTDRPEYLEEKDAREEVLIDALVSLSEPYPGNGIDSTLDGSSPIISGDEANDGAEKYDPRKLIEDENRAVGRIGRQIWVTYFSAVGTSPYWLLFVISMVLAALSPIAENVWLR